jgi:alanine-glyoxylate transaminase/serine-glyoxylate transaminase/serine-pyruvate transaminase
LALISVGERAWEWAERNEDEPHGWYLSLEPWRRYARDWGDWHPTPVTMPTNNIMGLRKSLERILSEGLDAHFARYRRAAQAVRQGLRALGFEMVVEGEFASPIATAVHARLEKSTPSEESFDLREFMDYLATEHEIIISGGLDALKGKIFRVGHMGKASTRLYLIDFLLAVEDYVRRLGRDIPVGTSLVGLTEAE